MTDNLLLVYGIQHTLHGSFHIFDCLIDDTVQTQVYTFLFCGCFCCCVRTNVETDDDRVGGGSQCYVRFVDSTYTTMDDLNDNFIIRQLHKTLLYSFHRSLNISFYDKIQFFQVTFLNLAEQIIQRHLRFCFFQQTVLIFRNKGCCKVLCFFIVFGSHQNFTCVRYI